MPPPNARPPSLPLLALTLFLCALMSFAWDLAQFDSFAPPSDSAIRRAAAAVVFTGDYARIDAALKLLAADRVPRLYISGVNGGAGLDRETFVAQFSQRNPELRGMDRLVACCVEMGEDAENTVQNAFETECWLERGAIKGPLLLVTGRTHMARALALLSRAAPRYQIAPLPIEDHLSDEARSEEWWKYVVTLILTRVPPLLSLEPFSGVFEQGCPPED